MRLRMQKLIWSHFGCKAVNWLIAIKLTLDMPCHLPNVYTKFQVDISKHVEKSPENSDGRKGRKIDGQTTIAMA